MITLSGSQWSPFDPLNYILSRNSSQVWIFICILALAFTEPVKLVQDTNDNSCDTQKQLHIKNLVVTPGKLTSILGESFKIFTKYVKVFDLYFVSTSLSPDEKLLHGAYILYQYIDNNDDGIPDNELVYNALVKIKATMVMVADDQDFERRRHFFSEIVLSKEIQVEVLQADETRPQGMMSGKFDASLEECFHLITVGYSIAYPETFGTKHGSVVSHMMDRARGGYFKSVPEKYPDGAWFTYNERKCLYRGMIIEYIYWAMTTILGAQEFRRNDIEDEWKPCTVDELKQRDNAIYQLLTNSIYKLPKKLPGPYRCQGST